MRSRKTSAALSAAGMLWVAGCSGGALHNGAYHPTVPVAGQSGIPANSPKVSLSFQIPARTTFASLRRTNSQGKARRTTTAAARAPQYISPAVVGGSVTIKIYQNGVSAFPDQTLSVGSTAGSQIYCSTTELLDKTVSGRTPQAIVGGGNCYNVAPVFAPLGNDTFFIEMFDSNQHLLSVTPGIPGTSFYGTAPSPVQVAQTGTYVTAYTSGIVGSVIVDTPTACTTFDIGTGNATAYMAFLDADGYPVLGSFANPVSLSLSGSGFGIFESGFSVGSSLTVYGQAIFGSTYAFESTQLGGSSTVGSAVTPTGSIPINVKALYAVDHMAFAASGGTLSALGFAGSSPYSFACGSVPMMSNTATPATFKFSNPVAMGHDDSWPLLAVVDATSSGPVLDVIDMSSNDFGFLSNAYSSAAFTGVGVVQAPLPAGSGPFDVAVSPNYGGNAKIYVSNAAGNSVGVVDDSNMPSSVSLSNTIAYGVSDPIGLALNPSSGDTLFVTSGNTPMLTEVDNAAFSPSIYSFSLVGRFAGAYPFSSAAVTSAAVADNASGEAVFAAFDPNLTGQKSVLISCSSFPGSCYGSFAAAAIGSTALGVDALSVYSTGIVALPSGSNVSLFSESGSSFGNFLTGLSATPTRTFGSGDQVWTGVFFPSTVSASFFPNASATKVGSLLGSAFTISTLY